MMFDRKGLKQKARKNLKHNYFRAVIVAFIAFILVNEGYDLVSYNINHNTETSNYVNNFHIIDSIFSGFDSYVDASNASKGILAIFVNNIASANSFFVGILNGLNQIIFHNQIASALIIFSGILLGFIFWLFISSTFEVGRNRFFIEKVNHKDTPFDKIFFVFRVRKALHVALIMFLRQVYTLLWCLTIIGGVIKYYSYLMIPYILAENPGISKKEAFRLSKEMMRGNKFNCFKMDLSFIGWKILGLFTLNISNLLITEPYYQMTYGNLYLDLREKALVKNEEFNKLFTDKRLLEVCDVYPEGVAKRNIRRWLKIDYNREYSVLSLVLIFFTISMMGWVWEVTLNLFRTGEFVNKGTLFGPWLPIYGAGGTIILVLLSKIKEKPLFVFLLSLIIGGFIEYVVSVYLELVYDMRWWDYSGFFMNIDGRICLEVLILFGLAGMTVIYVIAPLLDNLYTKIPYLVKIVICTILVTLFAMDFITSTIMPNSGAGITTIAMILIS